LTRRQSYAIFNHQQGNDARLTRRLKMTRNQQEIISYLNSKKIVYGFKTVYENNAPVKTEWMPIKITKKDQFYRANGVVVSHSWAKFIVREGMGA